MRSRVSASAPAIVAAAGMPSATSRAKFGPVRTKAGQVGWSSARISSGRRRVRASTPLAQTTRGAVHGGSWAATARRYCMGTARRIASAWAGRWGVTRIVPGRRMPGRRGLSRVRSISAAPVVSRAQRVTERPARAAWIARAVPQAPAPMTAISPAPVRTTLLMAMVWHSARIPAAHWPRPHRARRRCLSPGTRSVGEPPMPCGGHLQTTP